MKTSSRLSKVTLAGLLLSAIISGVATADDYTGTVRIFMVEPTSRWADGNGDPYGFGFLDFALEENIDLKDYDAWEQTVSFNPSTAGFEDVTEDNIMAMVVVFNSDSVQTDAFPGYEYYFWAYYTDAAAAATPGEIALNSSDGGFSHTVWVEQSGSGG